LAAMRNGREIRGVGLDQDPIEWGEPRGLADGLGFGKREDAAEAQMESEIERLARFRRAAGEAVEDAWAGVMFAQNLHGVAPGLTGVNDDRLGRELQLTDEYGALRVARRKVI